MQQEGFHTLLSNIMDEEDIKYQELKEMLEKVNIDISKRSLYRYASGEFVPKFKVAKAICDVLLINNITDQDLLEALELTRMQTEDNYNRRLINKSKNFEKTISIPLEGFRVGLGLEKGHEQEIPELILERMKEIYPGDKLTFSNYVRDLIVEDIVSGTLDEKGEENDG